MKRKIKYKIVEIDRRYYAFGSWEWLIRFYNFEDFNRFRVWAWRTFGPSAHYKTIDTDGEEDLEAGINFRWSWQDDIFERKQVFRIYLNHDTDLTLVRLKLSEID